MSELRRFDLDGDYPKICDWWIRWGHAVQAKEDLPPVGYINDNAACFVLETKSNLCFIDSLVSTHDVDAVGRSKDITEVIDACLKYAKEHDYKYALAITEKQSVLNRSVNSLNAKWVGTYELIKREL